MVCARARTAGVGVEGLEPAVPVAALLVELHPQVEQFRRMACASAPSVYTPNAPVCCCVSLRFRIPSPGAPPGAFTISHSTLSAMSIQRAAAQPASGLPLSWQHNAGRST